MTERKKRMVVTHIGVADNRVRYSSGDFKNQLKRFKDPNQDWFHLPHEMDRMRACEYVISEYKDRIKPVHLEVLNTALHYHFIRYKTQLNKEIKNGKVETVS